MFSKKYLPLLCALAAGGLLQAQNAPAPPQRDNVMFVAKGPVVATQAQFIGGEFNYSKLVKGAPYTADAVSETTQTLADGNRITRKSTTSLARDSAGRTRREETVGAVGPWSTGGGGEAPKVVFINDPVTHTNYVLEPNHIARAMKVENGDAATSSTSSASKSSGETKTMTVAGPVVMREGEFAAVAPPVPDLPPPGVASAGAGPAIFFNQIGASTQNAKTEDLGQQTIQGVVAQGHRTTMTIPAGQMGNERPIEIVNETWYSPELQTTVMSKRSDPRFGDTTYQLTNIERAEPDPMLFQVPSDYKIEDGPQRVLKLQLDSGAVAK